MAIKKTHKGTAPAGGGSSSSVNPSIFDPKDPQHSAVITAVVKMKRKDGEGKFTAVTCELTHKIQHTDFQGSRDKTASLDLLFVNRILNSVRHEAQVVDSKSLARKPYGMCA